ncbi:hypothetical protein J6590_077055 [Homalodisca vitripennis]|nr:hypothetical protein J6590_077055 [Homalodisca vitripennis]
MAYERFTTRRSGPAKNIPSMWLVDCPRPSGHTHGVQEGNIKDGNCTKQLPRLTFWSSHSGVRFLTIDERLNIQHTRNTRHQL